MRFTFLAVALILPVGIPVFAQGVDSAPAGITCRDWKTDFGNPSGKPVMGTVAVPSMKFAYLRGLRYGYEVAVQNLENLFDKHGKRQQPGKPASKQRVPDDPQKVFARVAQSVFVAEFLTKDGYRMVGSSNVAVAIGSDRLVAAPKNADVNLVLKEGGSVRVRQGPKTWQATLSNFDSDRGLCWLQVEGINARAVSLRQSSTLRDGERLFGLSEHVDQTVDAPLRESEGAIASLLAFGQSEVIKVKGEVFFGFQGGALFDAEGRLAGLGEGLVFGAGGRSRVFAAPAEWAMDWRSGLLPPIEFFSIDSAGCPRWHSTAWKEIALDYVARQDPETAGKAYQNGLRCSPDDAQAWNGLGFSRRMSKEFGSAIAAYREAVRLDPSLADAWSGLGDAYVAVGQIAEAVEAYENAVKRKPKDFRVWQNLAFAYEKLGQGAKAALAFEQAQKWESAPENDETPFYQALVKAEPESAAYWYGLGQAHARMKRHREAVSAYKESIRWGPLDGAVWFDLGSAYKELKEYKSAAEAYRKAIELNPTAEVWYLLGAVYANLNQWRSAAEAFGEGIRLKPEDALSWYALGAAYCKLGETQKVISVHDQLRAMGAYNTDDFFREVVQKSGSNCRPEQRKQP